MAREPGPLFNKALTLARRLHRKDRRKGATQPPYIGHLLGVAAIVIDAGADDEIAAAALLHDAVEDHPDKITYALLSSNFTPRVARIVRECSDGKVGQRRDESTWWTRKQDYIRHLSKCSRGGRLVSLADKLYNARASVLDLRAGRDPWGAPHVHAPARYQLRYYRALVRAFKARPPAGGGGLVREFETTVATMNQLASRRT